MEDSEGIFMILAKLSHACEYEATKKMEYIGINPGQAGVLFLLKTHGTLSQKDLAAMLHMKAPSVTSALQKMEQKKLIERMVDKDDKRITRIAITHEGTNLLGKIGEVSKLMQETICKGMSEEEINIFRKLLFQSFGNFIEEKKKDLKKMRGCIE